MNLATQLACAAPASAWPGADLFAGVPVRKLTLDIPPAEFDQLRKEPRQFVHATLSADGATYTNVGVHLKGAIGSFRPLDDKPGLTLDFAQFKSAQRFHGLRRIHLNNSVEDPSYLNQQLGSELVRTAGIPAPRVTHALVQLNGRSLGLYVLVEGFTEDFLACHFKTISGDLYEPEDGHDLDGRLKRMSIPVPHRGREELAEVAAAAQETDHARRWQRLEKVLDLDRFLSFMAMEVILGHRDGYCLARNNFRVYLDTDSHKLLFLPHGMDQLFTQADLSWQPFMAGLVAAAVLDTPEGKEKYRERFSTLVTNVLQIDSLSNHIARLVSSWQPFLGHREFSGIEREAAALTQRIVARQMSLTRQLLEPPLKPLDFTQGFAPLAGWVKVDEPLRGTMDQTISPLGKPALHIATQANTCASWRTKAALKQGHYTFAGRTRIAGVKPLPYGKHQGAGLRVTGSLRQPEDFVGDSSGRLLEAPFQIDSPSAVIEFVCELRASAGEVWFDLDSLRVLQREPQTGGLH
jgi:hypothetical protein